MFSKGYHIFFSGIGGIGMSGIAEILLIDGYKVSGSDLKLSSITERLKSLGAEIYEGHSAANVSEADVVVRSTAVRDTNPEIVEAVKRGIPVIQRAEMLREIMRGKYTIAVAGAHGKTTTTSLTGEVLIGGELDPTVVVGGKMIGKGTNALKGEGKFFVAEADESDGSFLKYVPTVTVVTNIDREHLDYYDGIDDIKRTFTQFVNRTRFYGCSLLCSDDEYVKEIIPDVEGKYITYGFNEKAELRAYDLNPDGDGTSFKVSFKGGELGEVKLGIPGVHNVLNSLAAIGTGLFLDIDFESIKNSLRKVEGVKRRLEFKGERDGITVVDDYGHHPTEIVTTLNAVKKSWDDKRVVVMFQPHRYTRTKALYEEFSEAFNDSDVLIMLPVYAASEDPISGISGEALSLRVKEKGHNNVIYKERDEALSFLEGFLKEGDLLLTLGAGDVVKLGEEFIGK